MPNEDVVVTDHVVLLLGHHVAVWGFVGAGSGSPLLLSLLAPLSTWGCIYTNDLLFTSLWANPLLVPSGSAPCPGQRSVCLSSSPHLCPQTSSRLECSSHASGPVGTDPTQSRLCCREAWGWGPFPECCKSCALVLTTYFFFWLAFPRVGIPITS